jgi:hypothetical protein
MQKDVIPKIKAIAENTKIYGVVRIQRSTRELPNAILKRRKLKLIAVLPCIKQIAEAWIY